MTCQLKNFDLEELICDSCSGGPIYKSYPARDFSVVTGREVDSVSKGDWAACKACAELIDQEKWDELADRTLAALPQGCPSDPAVKDALYSFVKSLHSRFREHRLSVQ